MISDSPLGVARRAAVFVLMAGIVSLGGCELFKKDVEVQGILNQRAVGMQAGQFFDRYGSAFRKEEQLDGTTIYDWISQIPKAAPGYAGQDQRTCTLRLTTDRRGKIITTQVLVDDPGRISASRCGEIFKAAP